MADERIRTYYLLCTTRAGNKAHIVSTMGDKLGAIMTKKEVELFLRRRDNIYEAREIVIGGATAAAEITPSRASTNYEPAIVIM